MNIKPTRQRALPPPLIHFLAGTLVTGKGDKALIDEGKKWGLNNFLAKPFTVPALKTCIEAVVGKLT